MRPIVVLERSRLSQTEKTERSDHQNLTRLRRCGRENQFFEHAVLRSFLTRGIYYCSLRVPSYHLTRGIYIPVLSECLATWRRRERWRWTWSSARRCGVVSCFFEPRCGVAIGRFSPNFGSTDLNVYFLKNQKKLSYSFCFSVPYLFVNLFFFRLHTQTCQDNSIR